MPKKRKILPCPCCKNKDIEYKEISAVRCYIKCLKCELTIKGKYLKSIIKKWNKRPEEKYDKIYIEGNNGGDFISIKHIKDNLIKLEVGDCCVYIFNHEIPVEILASFLAKISYALEDEKTLLKELGWDSNSKYNYDLLKQIKSLNFWGDKEQIIKRTRINNRFGIMEI